MGSIGSPFLSAAWLGGLAGGLFSRIVIIAARVLPGKLGRTIKKYPIVFALACGVVVAVCGITSGDTVYGTGYAQVKAALEGVTPLRADFGLLKFLATTFSTISGIFSPSLAVGAGLDANIAHLFPARQPAPSSSRYGVIFRSRGAGADHRVVIVTEMTDNHAMVIPLMTSALIAYAASRLVCPEGAYHALAKGFAHPQTN